MTSRKILTVLPLSLACSSASSPAGDKGPSVPLQKGAPLRFEFTALDGRPVTNESLAGRITVIGFVATYDVASQAQARFLAGLARRHVPRLNVAALVLEPPENRPL